MSDVWSLAPYRTAATPTSKNWQRDAKSIRLSRPVLRLPSRQHGISRLRPATPGILSYALGNGTIAYLDAVTQAMAAHTTKLNGAP